MLPRARQEYILRQVELHGSVRAQDVARDLDVHQVTVRRDIVDLESQGLVHRVHGGAVSARPRRRTPAARTLIGVVVPSSTFYYSDVIAGMESVAGELGLRIVLGISEYQPQTERQQVERLLALGVKGMVLTPTLHRSQEPGEVARWLESIPVPVAVMERRIQGSLAVRELDSVATDHRHGALLAVDHFARLGHRSVLLAIHEDTPTAPAIRVGYEQAVEQLGLDRIPVVLLQPDRPERAGLDAQVEALIDERENLGTRAILAHSDQHATLLVEAAQLRGLHVPGDLAVIAYDDVIAVHAAVPLTAVTPPRKELGREALRLIERRLRTSSEPVPRRHAELLPRLTVRESCGAPAPSAPVACP